MIPTNTEMHNAKANKKTDLLAIKLT